MIRRDAGSSGGCDGLGFFARFRNGQSQNL
jgi:hypothetical protein